MRTHSPVAASLTPSLVAGGFLIIRLVNSLISSSVNFMPAMPLRAVNSLSSARLSLTLDTNITKLLVKMTIFLVKKTILLVKMTIFLVKMTILLVKMTIIYGENDIFLW